MQIEGVLSVESGFMGGHVENPTYEETCYGETGHAEVVRVEFNPTVLAYWELLEVFLSAHDPTTLDQQGEDVGPQYRSVIFYENEVQRAEAKRVIADWDAKRVFDAPIVTAIEPAQNFWKAEEYHQKFYANHPSEPYCALNVAPKVAKVRAKYRNRLKADLVAGSAN